MTKKQIIIALAGNANVGKSVIFNHLTGMHQHIGNWPGKTVERAEGTLHFKGYTINIVDLPGIYSLSTFSIEELISREYIAIENPDLVINVVDASVLERNLFFTLQLIELETPMIVALNQMDMAKKKGIKIDHKKLEKALGVPVIPTVAPSRVGIYDLLQASVNIIEKGKVAPSKVRYGEEVEEKILELINLVGRLRLPYPARWVAIKLLEGEEQIEGKIRQMNPKILSAARRLAEEIEGIHGHSCSTVITSERYEIAGCIAREVQQIVSPIKPPKRERLHGLTTHKLLGYPIMAAVILSIFFGIFSFGDCTSGLLSDIFYGLEPVFENVLGTGIVGELLWGGVVEGLIAGITIALPYLLPFYSVLYFLEDSGYLSRVAFLMDNLMHKIGLHGKAFIPVILGFGCNVPACLGCRIMETKRERLIAVFVVTLVPCAATTVIILGLVGAFVGVQWALLLYAVDLLIIFALGRVAFKALPGEPTGLIMEMHDYKVPHAKTIVKQTLFRLEEFIKMAFPLIIAGSFVIKLVDVLNLLEPIADALSPVTVGWLGLPAITGITLIFGVLRKELTLIMLATLLETSNFAAVPGFGPVQMMVFTLVAMLYIPCISTIGALVKELGWKKALLITVFEIIFAIVIGGIAYRILLLASIW
ncbi:MAG: ferrous iron transport protein B [Candidatus Bathyarchaeota archaeon]|nr:ferrous iron transport protein B [Candidatus Bathyarchaeota archaeon]MDH5494596.1 ferrous iron transport protein B [Candidatus Bathyarchaeota archaeon]